MAESSRARLTICVVFTVLLAVEAAAQHGSKHGSPAIPTGVPTHGTGQHVTLPHTANADGNDDEKPVEIPEPKRFVTNHSIKIGRETLSYTAVAEETHVKTPAGTPSASIFSVSYFRKDLISEPAQRPITFVFNGGPGSSSVWLHLGAFGPRRLDLGPDPLAAGAPPYELRANPHTLLTHTDLVFVDPVGTGYSRALGNANDGDFWGVDQDSACIAAFIRTFLTKHHRWNSPRYLAGESYGTVRAALLLRDLSLSTLNGVAFNGVILVSSALDTQMVLGGGPGEDLSYVFDLPTYAATAWYHDKLPDKPSDLNAFLNEARTFAGGEYLTALFQGDALPAERAREVASRLRRFTGLDEEFLLQCNLRVSSRRFLKELLRERGETLAMSDTRFRGTDPDEAGEYVAWDPFAQAMDGPFVGAINSYLGDELGVDMDRDYRVFSLEANVFWQRPASLSSFFSGQLYTVPYIAQAAATNRDFRIFVASGYHDLTTSFFGTEYTMNQSGIDRERITIENYYGGHMMYLHEPSLEKLSRDLTGFLEEGRRR